MKKFWWIALIVVLILVAGFFAYRAKAQSGSTTASNYQTATVQRGTVTSTISAAGTIPNGESAE